MPKLTIPNQYKPGVDGIQKLDYPTVQRLQEAIKNASPTAVLPGESSSLVPLISALGIENPTQLAEAICVLYRVKSEADGTVEEFADDVCDAIRASGADRDKFRKNLVALLSIDELGMSAKAWDLQTDDERTFCNGRILTDLRPVFGPNVSEGPKAMVIVHLLKLDYHQVGVEKHRQFDVSLDAEDIKTLRKIIDRAEEKAKSLKTTVSNFRYLARS